jgi:hypothetical protein
MASDAAGAVGPHGFRERRELMRGLAKELTAARLNVRTLSYAGNAVDPEDLIEEIEVTNHALPGRGTFRVCEDGGVSWEYWGSLDSQQGAGEIAATITALLATTVGAANAPLGSNTGDKEQAASV